MSTAAILWIIAAIVVIAVVVTLLVVRSRRRRAASTHRMGLPELGALSTTGLDKAHSGGSAKGSAEQ
jgi:cytochrome c-type biogenesis protein CcmH/NrfF